MTAFTQGKGDVALAYENEAIAAQKAGEKVDYVIPKDTIQIQTPIATTTDAGRRLRTSSSGCTRLGSADWPTTATGLS